VRRLIYSHQQVAPDVFVSAASLRAAVERIKPLNFQFEH
jgi:hypothetical protein